jgi:hypothetical protein
MMKSTLLFGQMVFPFMIFFSIYDIIIIKKNNNNKNIYIFMYIPKYKYIL